MTGPSTSTIRVAFRFNRKDAPRLRELARRCEADGDLKGAAIIFRDAASDAQVGEPYTMIVPDLHEARRIQAEFVLQGCRPPALEQLNG